MKRIIDSKKTMLVYSEAKYDKRINLIANDGRETKVSTVKDYIDNNNQKLCRVNFTLLAKL